MMNVEQGMSNDEVKGAYKHYDIRCYFISNALCTGIEAPVPGSGRFWTIPGLGAVKDYWNITI
jgi:hypothetical protein